MNYFKFYFISFLVCLVLLIFFIPFFRKIKFLQSIREEGPRSHLKKSGTPTMGGLFIILGSVVSFVIYFIEYSVSLEKFFLLLFPLISFGLIGFLDDGLIILKKNNKGIKPNLKLLLQIIFSLVYGALYLKLNGNTHFNIFGLKINLKYFYIILISLMLVSSSNAVNLSDGLDGLASGLLIIVLMGISILSYNRDISIFVFSLSLIGGIIGFLCYNFHPAKLFMGDVGSLSLGATVASLFILLKMELLLVVFGFVFILETLSVIIQVTYFKKTNGKRLFLMTPLHHHFELKGLKEWQIDFIFWIIALLMGTIGIYLGNKLF